VNRCFATYALQLGLIWMLASGCAPGETRQSEATPSTAVAGRSVATGEAVQASEEREACSLITIEEATQILGSPATATPRSTSNDRSACDYVTQSYQSFTIEAIWSGAEEEIKTARRAADMAATQAGGTQDPIVNDVMGLHRVEGLGDEAYFARRTMSYVRKGDVLLVFHTAGLAEPVRENWEALARAALARL
jgi:hypothetical protein